MRSPFFAGLPIFFPEAFIAFIGGAFITFMAFIALGAMMRIWKGVVKRVHR